ncbi:uncharacterized protein LOC133886299 [Phragmites australis]|uniref:uncharacterized protein LOC133886299 n=1 Tax=Phragmites australis TaxID=29695 RepID=UPI002D78F3B0|nr:uncharacterized protein LOC133886299 [Phragmites australis]
MYTGPNDITRTHISAEGDQEEGALVTLLRVVTGVDDFTRAVMPREQLALYADPSRVALQATLPEFDTRGLVDCPGRRNPRTIQILGVDEEAGTPRAAGHRPAVELLQAAAIRPAVGAPPVAERRPRGTKGNAPGRSCPSRRPRRRHRLHDNRRRRMARRREARAEVKSRAHGVRDGERAHRGRSTHLPSSQAPEPLLDVLGSAREVIVRLEAAVAVERVELNRDCAALVEERGWLEEVGRLLEAWFALARATHERSMRAVAEEREALEEVRDEAVAAQEKATCMERQAAERDQASRRRAAELLARERLLLAREEAVVKREKSVQSTQADLARRNDEFERSHAEVLCREEEVAIHETDVEITVTAQDAREEQIARREAEAASSLSTLNAQEEQAAKWEAELAAREQALAALAEKEKRGQAEAPTTSGVPTSAVEVISLEEWLQMTRGELETAWRSVREAGLGHVNVGEKGMDQEAIGHLALGFEEISWRLKALLRAVKELASREGCALA